ncbi:biopolymer transporter ExbD [bacterium]|nr:biopolymer transporter ExbD [bacterium]
MSELKGFSYRRERKTPELNISPLVDMVFLLLIFFLVTTTFSRETGVEVHKPKAKTARTLSRESVLISVTKEGTIHINNRKVDLEELNRIIKETLRNKTDSSIIIIVDKVSFTGRVIAVMDECKQAGAERISLAAMKEE